jgi:hypothetical protein
MKRLLLLILPLSAHAMHAMQTTLSFDEATRSLTIARPLAIRINSPTDAVMEKLPALTSPKPLTPSPIRTFDGMTVDEVKTWIVGTIAQYEEKHSLTLKELQETLDKHAAAASTAQESANNAQSTSKYAIIAAAVTGGCSIIICIASGLMSHYL